MNRHRRASELFLACCEMPGEERTAFLIESCGEDRELIEQVEGMLEFEERRPEFLAASAVRGVLGARDDKLPASIGPFRILRKLGQGGMGAVYEAQQESPHRTVALKVLQPFLHSPDALRRFEHEGEFLARLQHPGIAQIFDSGNADTEGGSLHYFALELVRGDPLTLYARERHLSLSARLELLARVADAVQHAHQHGVIHRDLKPANILVEESGQPKVLDFGIARASDSDIQLATQQTDMGQILGTLAYMSPEQTVGDSTAIDTRSDVYSLGVLLYELIADRLPYDVSGKSLPDAVRVIQEQAPSRLSAIDSAHRGDLETIVRTALEKDKERRYASAAELATDIRHYLQNEPIAARAPSRMYTLAKLVQRNKALTVSMAAGILALIGGLVASLILGGLAADTAAREKLRLEEVLRLSAAYRLEALQSEADRLWPPHPSNLQKYENWLNRSRTLLAGLEPNPAENDIGHRARLAMIEARALPYDDERREAARLSHPRYAELELLRVACAAFARASAVRAGEAEPELVKLDADSLPSSAIELIDIALPLVDLQRTGFGDEARGLALALFALERIEDLETEVLAQTTLAQALYAVGKPDEAIEAMSMALSIAPAAMRSETLILSSRLGKWYEAGLGPGGETETAELQAELAAVEAEVSERREWLFQSLDDDWWFHRLRQLVENLESFESGLVSADAIAGDHGWSVGRRRALARDMQQSFAVGGKHAQRWEEARSKIREAYDGLELAVQMGLVPLGADRDSGLWEFWHVASGAEPMRDPENRIVMAEDSGLVFVLLPGGTFMMGAQSRHPDEPNYLPPPHTDLDGPLHEQSVDPFFLSKYEMTQGQWEWLTGEIPCYYTPGANVGGVVTSRLHPVETVSWSDCWLVLGRLGLQFPTEAEWEYAARAGSSTPWWTGSDPELLEGKANLLDRFAMTFGGAAAGWGPPFMEWNDGYSVHAPVGSFDPNPFGLYDVVGNLWERCLDPYAADRRHADFRYRELDRLARVDGGPLRPYRGGGYMDVASLARCTVHGIDSPIEAVQFVGIRPARAITEEHR